MSTPSSPPSLDLVFAALADPTRRAILALLADGETSVTTLTESFNISQPAISKHLKVLERAGLLSRGRVARFRPCRLNAAPLEQAARWIGGYRPFWEASSDNLDAFLRASQQPPSAHSAPPQTSPQESEEQPALQSPQQPSKKERHQDGTTSRSMRKRRPRS